MFGVFPWENGKEPDFVNEEGFSWYIDKGITKWATEERYGGHPVDLTAYLVAKDNKPICYALVQDGNLIYDNTSMEAVACYIDVLRLLESDKQ